MNIICINTGTVMSVTAQGKADPVTSVLKPAGGQYSAHLIPLIEKTIEQAGFGIHETGMVVCPQGPGSFTGLRIAYAAAKAIAFGTGAAFYCIPSLHIIETGSPGTHGQTLAVMDAKRNKFYVQLFKNSRPAGAAADICAEKALGLLDTKEPALICGFGTEKFKTDIGEKAVSGRLSFFETKPEKLSALMCAYVLEKRELVPVNDYDGPVYIRKSDAEKET